MIGPPVSGPWPHAGCQDCGASREGHFRVPGLVSAEILGRPHGLADGDRAQQIPLSFLLTDPGSSIRNRLASSAGSH